MAQIKYNESQRDELKSNKYVKNCTEKHVVFKKDFKFEAIKLHKIMIPKEIFKKFWFPEYIINSEIPKNSIARWEKNINEKWVIEENKWRKIKEYFDISKMNKDEYIEYLEAKLALVEELKKIDKWEYP